MNTLEKGIRDLDKVIEEISCYAAVNPRLEMFVNLLKMTHNVGEELVSTNDILGDLSNVPDNFSEVLDTFNLIVSKDNDTVSVVAVPKADGMSLKNRVEFEDTGFVGCLLKLYAYYQGESLDGIEYQRYRVKTALGGHLLDISYPTDVPAFIYVMNFDKGNCEKFEIENLKDTPDFKFLDTGREGLVRALWTKPYNGLVVVKGDTDEQSAS